MKTVRVLTVILFAMCILIPVLTFNFEEDAISLIDNRKLTANPFSEEALNDGSSFTNRFENYISDRIGFRDDMILAYAILNDRLFHKMVHPVYVYGKDGYVFGEGLTVDVVYTEYHQAFADMVKKIQDYCEARGVPFLFAFDPAKPAVLTDYIPAGINYDRTWVDSFLAALDERNVRYIDNTPLLKEKVSLGEMVFNQKFDANHWNGLGAYYGTNAMLEELKKDFPAVHINTLDEMTVEEKLQTSLLVSEFPINEMVPSIMVDMTSIRDNASAYTEELNRHSQYSVFGYYINETRIEEGAPRALVFQGSYMNGVGYKYFANGFGEYIYVHDYQNVIDFPYYFNIFQPDCVIFEVAEYTFDDSYFNYDNMCAMDLNPVLQTVINKSDIYENQLLETDSFSVERGDMLTVIRWAYADSADYVWLKMDKEYDMKRVGDGFEVTVLSEIYDRFIDNIQIVVSKGGSVITYSLND